MVPGNIIRIKFSIFFLVISFSIYFLYLSYQNYQNIILDQAIVLKSDDYNYFEPRNFRKYYDEIIIEDLESFTTEEIKENYKENDLIQYKTNTIKIDPGDNFAKVLNKAGIESKDIDKIILNGKKIYDFSKIYAGDNVKVSFNYKDENLIFLQINYQFSEEEILNVSFNEGKYNYSIDLVKLTSEEIFAKGIIETSLYKSMKDQGLSEIVIEEMIRVFSFDVDFQRDIYKGDQYEILFIKKINNKGKTIKIDDPLYLKLYSRGTPLTYYLFSTSEFSEYYDENGKGMTKSLMKTPINGAKLSSGYGMRKHPISGYDKLHKGVDFAAPSGTPVFAAGNGVIEFIGKNGGYGKFVKIRHDGEYKTAYAHLKGYKKGLFKGARVKQGDVIGYVGNTGNSTGPHLHYEIIKNNKQINPKKLKLPSGRNLNKDEMNDFNKIKIDIVQKIKSYAS